MSLDDRDLIQETLDGSHAAFALLMQRYERLVYRFVFTYVRDPDDALDLTQDTFIRTYEKLGTYVGRGQFRSWLLRVAHSVSVNWLRSRRRQRDRQTQRDLESLEVRVVPSVQETARLRGEEREMILSELERLNSRQRVAVTLRYFERLPIREIAAVLECSEGTAKNLLFRGLDKMRRRLVPQRESVR